MAKKHGASPGRGMQILGILGGVMLMVAAWRFPIPLPQGAHTTLLSLIAVLYGIILGPRRGTLIVALYVLAVILGLPAAIWRFAPDSTPFLSLPINGLTFGLVFAALAAGLLTPEGAQSNPSRIALAAFFGHLAYLVVGTAWLAQFAPLSRDATVMLQTQTIPVLIKSTLAFIIALAAGRLKLK